VMVGRAAYRQPAVLAALDAALFAGPAAPVQPQDVVEPLSRYLEAVAAQGTAPWAVLRHTLGLFHGTRGARAWRRRLSDPAFVARYGVDALRAASADLATA